MRGLLDWYPWLGGQVCPVAAREGDESMIARSSAVRRVSASNRAALRTSRVIFSATCSIVAAYTPCTVPGCTWRERVEGSNGLGWNLVGFRSGDCAFPCTCMAGDDTFDDLFDATSPSPPGARRIAAIWRSAPARMNVLEESVRGLPSVPLCVPGSGAFRIGTPAVGRRTPGGDAPTKVSLSSAWVDTAETFSESPPTNRAAPPERVGGGDDWWSPPS